MMSSGLCQTWFRHLARQLKRDRIQCQKRPNTKRPVPDLLGKKQGLASFQFYLFMPPCMCVLCVRVGVGGEGVKWSHLVRTIKKPCASTHKLTDCQANRHTHARTLAQAHAHMHAPSIAALGASREKYIISPFPNPGECEHPTCLSLPAPPSSSLV